MKKIIYLLPIIVFVVAGCSFQSQFNNDSLIKSKTPSQDKGNDVVCTQEVKLCPDGNAVARVFPNCEFAPCPNQKKSTSTLSPSTGGIKNINLPSSTDSEVKFCTQEVKLCSDGTYVGRRQPNCEFAVCPK